MKYVVHYEEYDIPNCSPVWDEEFEEFDDLDLAQSFADRLVQRTAETHVEKDGSEMYPYNRYRRVRIEKSEIVQVYKTLED